MKDYYSILEIEPSASLPEIKKAYRKLAHLYHPDKTSQDPYAAAKFTAIKEAYEVLTNPIKKEYYLQQRWYEQSTGKKKKEEPLTPLSMLKDILELDRYVARLDEHRMDRNGLYDHLMNILDESRIQAINSFKEPDVNKEIVVMLMRISRFLSYQQNNTLALKWKQLTTDEVLEQKITQHLRHHQRIQSWEKYKPFVILLIVILICILMFLLTG